MAKYTFGKKSSILALCLGGMLALSACSTSSTVESTNFDQAAIELAKTNPKVVKNNYFALGIPEGWKIISYDSQELDTHISVEKTDRSAIVTIRINKASAPNIEESCALAKQGFDANGIEYTNKPGVSFGTCLINGIDKEKETALWLRQYEDDNSAYSISYIGSLENASQVLTQLAGNDKLMQLMVRPL